MKVIQTTYSVHSGIAPVKYRGRIYNPASTKSAKIVKCFDKSALGFLYQKKNGEYFVTFMLTGVGHFVGIPTESETKVMLIGE